MARAEARFRVLTAAEESEMEAALKKSADNPLARAAIYARFGLRQAAADELRTAIEKDPANATAARWLRQLEGR